MSFDDVLRQIVSRAAGPIDQVAPPLRRTPNTLGSSTPMPPSAADLALAQILMSAYSTPNTLGSSAPLPPAPWWRRWWERFTRSSEMPCRGVIEAVKRTPRQRMGYI